MEGVVVAADWCIVLGSRVVLRSILVSWYETIPKPAIKRREIGSSLVGARIMATGSWKHVTIQG